MGKGNKEKLLCLIKRFQTLKTDKKQIFIIESLILEVRRKSSEIKRRPLGVTHALPEFSLCL